LSSKPKLSSFAQKKLEDYEEDDLAETLALAKKMIRKKDRDAILDASINKYNMADNADDLPVWFVDNEKKHVYKAQPVTKDEVKVEKDRLREWKDRPSKKVMEAKFRKKKKQMAELKRFKNKADDIFEQSGLDEKSKIREVGKAFAHAQRKIKKTKEKQIITGKKHMTGTGGGKTSGRKFRMVDSRGKKDLRAEKRAERKKRGVKPNATKKKFNRR